MSITVDHLTKSYGSKAALKNISAEIREARVTGLVGHNGAGKSTLIKLITGLIYPTEGSAAIDGFDVHDDRKRALTRLGAIVEWPSFYSDLSARCNLALLSGGYGKAYDKKLKEVTDFLGIGDILDRKAGVLSTGMKQRLGIALALLPDSKYIILDEPANGLDPEGIAEIRHLIKACSHEAGVTVLVSSHLLSEVEMICDDIIMLSNGELKAAGELQTLLAGRVRLRVAADDGEKLKRFLEQACSERRPWITSAPETAENSCLFSIPPGADIAEISTLLFKEGFALKHFAPEPQKLEDFFLSHSSREKNK